MDIRLFWFEFGVEFGVEFWLLVRICFECITLNVVMKGNLRHLAVILSGFLGIFLIL